MHPYIAVPATLLLVFRAISQKSLTNAGVVVAALTAAAHAYHPWNAPFALLVVFFLAGSRVTHIKEDVKKTLTLSSKGAAGGEGPRTHVQVLANSLVASILCLAHGYQLRQRQSAIQNLEPHLSSAVTCYPWRGDLLYVGIVANYLAVAADTFSSELGILSSGEPRLITSWNLRKVPRGTNGGVSLVGLLAGAFGAMTIVTAAVVFTPVCTELGDEKTATGAWWTTDYKRKAMVAMVVWGILGSLLDSMLGGLLQSSVKDVRSGKIVEGEGGNRVLVTANHPPAGSEKSGAPSYADVAAEAQDGKTSGVDTSARGKARGNKGKDATAAAPVEEKSSRVSVNGWDLLDNNDVNFAMATIMSVGAMFAASWVWDIPIQTVLSP